MERTVNIDKTYRCSAGTAIARFFREHEELSYWRETFQWMLENNEENFCDDRYANGRANPEWSYSLWLITDITGTYIAVIERA